MASESRLVAHTTPLVSAGGQSFYARQPGSVRIVLALTIIFFLLVCDGAQAETFYTWKAKKFSNAQLADPAISGEQADPDQDGLSNLLEYGAGLEPLLNQNLLPVQVELSAQGALSLLVRQVPALSDLTYLFESTTDLHYWITHNTTTETSRVTLGAGVFQLAITLPPDPAATNRRFARIRMVRQPTDLLEPPAEVTAQLLFPSGALVRWSDRSPIESGFLVERRAADSDTYVTVGSVLPDTITLTDPAVQWSDDWIYRVTALDGNTGESSDEVELEKPTDSDGDGIPDLWETRTFFTNPLLADSDRDGIPDGWEVRHGMSPLVNDSALDADGDGLTNLQEYQRGSDPKDYFSQGRTPITPRIFIYSGGGARVEAGEYSTNPIVFKIVNAATETPLVNAPVTVDISSGTGKVSLTRGGPTTSSMVILSDAQGLVRAYFKAPREVRSHTSS